MENNTVYAIVDDTLNDTKHLYQVEENFKSYIEHQVFENKTSNCANKLKATSTLLVISCTQNGEILILRRSDNSQLVY